MGMNCNCCKSVKVSDLAGSFCNKVSYERCIVQNYKMPIPEEEDDSQNCILLGYCASSSGNHLRR